MKRKMLKKKMANGWKRDLGSNKIKPGLDRFKTRGKKPRKMRRSGRGKRK